MKAGGAKRRAAGRGGNADVEARRVEDAVAGEGDRLSLAFAAARARGEAALITYVMGGDPNPRDALQMALACVEGGADILEIGIPFSDPIADGPTIQRAAMRALQSGTTLEDCLELVARLRKKTDVPVALMGYLNPVLAYGEKRFFERCAQVGVDALILPDLPPEEATSLCALAAAQGVKTVFLAAPTSTAARIEAVTRAATGFVYFVSVTGVTGGRKAAPEEVAEQIAPVRAKSRTPVVIGFGVSSPDQAKALGVLADGVVVGSAIVERVGAGGTTAARAAKVKRFVAELKRGLRRRS